MEDLRASPLELAPTMAQGAEEDSAQAPPPPELLERYADLDYLGEGGMGVVYRARDPRLDRVVALKILKRGDPELSRRFVAEGRAQARVTHENVCRVYEAGTASGTPFIAMQYIEGQPLARLAASLSREEIVRLLREIAQAVHEAHRHGLIHRDIKPSNILVERAEDGSWKPYIVDFGLAREVEDRGQTRTGAVIGTPAYMSPEQALGEVRSLDRRSDVWSLGATLYDALAGRPPFVGEHPWKVLLGVAYEDPPALRAIRGDVPRDLETIVMKCLERDPGRRYESARALAEDLGRYLDGDPILGRRPSIARAAAKWASRHRLATGLLALLLAGGALFSGAWLRAARASAERARIAQRLGENVKEMELFLRYAYARPLHDVELERDVVRARLAEIEQEKAALGDVGVGPGEYALGRGALALGDPRGAREHLERALAAGYASPELRLSLGRALGEELRRAVEDASRIGSPEERRRKIEEAQKTLGAKAIEHLSAAADARIEVPEYVEGLIALYQGDPELAIARARAASEKAPWMYEAKKLLGDALYALGSRHRHDAAFDYDRMKASFDPAARAYAEAAETARSDPEVHRAECELWEKIGMAEVARGASPRAAFDSADAACSRAVAASHADVRARLQKALVMSAATYATADRSNEQALASAEAALAAADEAVAASGGDLLSSYARARALFERSSLLASLGKDPAVDRTIAAYEGVVARDPTFVWAWNELGQALLMKAGTSRSVGKDPSPSLKSAEESLERASRLDPTFSLAAQNLVEVAATRLEYELSAGKSSDAAVGALFDALPSFAARKGSGAWIVVYWEAKGRILRARHDLAHGRDPRGDTASARDMIRAFAGEKPLDAWLRGKLVESLLVDAGHAKRAGLPLGPSLAELRASAQDLVAPKEDPSPMVRELLARIEIVALDEAEARGAVTEAMFDAALAPVRPLLTAEIVDAEASEIAATVEARRKAWIEGNKRRPHR